MNHPSTKTYSLLSLGDSYTIGEQVLLQESFPYQTVQLLREKGLQFAAPEIIAKTGWTTDELLQAIKTTHFLPHYDFVTLLIGVNNQYRGRTIENYATEFEELLQTAIAFCKNKKNVSVLSIPDWGATPFASDRDTDQIAKEINAFNELNKKITEQYQVQYLYITDGTRQAAVNKLLLAADGLHYSGIEYNNWAKKLAAAIAKNIL